MAEFHGFDRPTIAQLEDYKRAVMLEARLPCGVDELDGKVIKIITSEPQEICQITVHISAVVTIYNPTDSKKSYLQIPFPSTKDSGIAYGLGEGWIMIVNGKPDTTVKVEKIIFL